tara:strand:+ start:257 stop:430 length:174 start_codon:yes stop_codon:yes gene_type:complete
VQKPHEVYDIERYPSMNDETSNKYYHPGAARKNQQLLNIIDNSEPSEEYSLNYERQR